MFSGTWRSQKINLWVKLRSKTYCKLSLKFKENRKICCFFSKIIFQAKYSNAVSACKMQNLTIWVPNLYEATHLEQFWYPGHHHSPKIKEKIKNIKLGEKLAKNVKFLNFWKKIWKKFFFFLKIFIFQALIALLPGVLEAPWGYEKCSPSSEESKKSQNEWSWCSEHTRNLTQKWSKIEKIAFFWKIFFQVLAKIAPKCKRLSKKIFFSKTSESFLSPSGF